MSEFALKHDEDGLRPGFADPVHDAQRTFRALLQAMARPGTQQACGGGLARPEPLSPAMAALCLTLADADTPLWLSPALRRPAVSDYLKFHCGAPLCEGPAVAGFALARAEDMPALHALASGDDRYPDRGATLVVEVPALETGASHGWTLRGPGIEDTARLRVDGLPGDFPDQWRRNGAVFPCGVDVVLTHADRAVALPRTTRLEG